MLINFQIQQTWKVRFLPSPKHRKWRISRLENTVKFLIACFVVTLWEDASPPNNRWRQWWLRSVSGSEGFERAHHRLQTGILLITQPSGWVRPPFSFSPSLFFFKCWLGHLWWIDPRNMWESRRYPPSAWHPHELALAFRVISIPSAPQPSHGA